MYARALEKVIGELKRTKDEVHVLDIGAGTGLLSMLAVRAGATRVTALEYFQPMAHMCQKVLNVNGMNDRVKLIHQRSTDVETCKN